MTTGCYMLREHTHTKKKVLCLIHAAGAEETVEFTEVYTLIYQYIVAAWYAEIYRLLSVRLQTCRALIFSRVCLSVCVCLCVSDRHFCPSTLIDFDETWSQGPYSDLVWLRP